LATNAVKYRSLSRDGGKVAIRGRVAEAGEEGPELILDWRETGGPRVAEPSHRGFG